MYVSREKGLEPPALSFGNLRSTTRTPLPYFKHTQHITLTEEYLFSQDQVSCIKTTRLLREKYLLAQNKSIHIDFDKHITSLSDENIRKPLWSRNTGTCLF